MILLRGIFPFCWQDHIMCTGESRLDKERGNSNTYQTKLKPPKSLIGSSDPTKTKLDTLYVCWEKKENKKEKKRNTWLFGRRVCSKFCYIWQAVSRQAMLDLVSIMFCFSQKKRRRNKKQEKVWINKSYQLKVAWATNVCMMAADGWWQQQLRLRCSGWMFVWEEEQCSIWQMEIRKLQSMNN